MSDKRTPPNEAPFTLTLWGDWSPGIGMEAAPLSDPAALYGGLYPILQRADANLLNLEGVFAPPEAAPILKDGKALPLPPAALPALSPFRMVCLANNHILDYGEAGLRHTLETLAREGIAWTGVRAPLGAPPSPPKPLPEWLHIINAAEGEEARSTGSAPGALPFDLPALRAEVQQQAMRGRSVVVILHGGREHLCFPAPYMRRACRSLVESGAALVVGHHPHVPQGIETWRGATIAYSLGNFVLYPATRWRWHTLGYGLEVRFLYPGSLPEVYVHPYEITPRGLRALDGEAGQTFVYRTLPELSAPIEEAGKLEALWDAYADEFLRERGMEEIIGALGALGGTRWGTASLWRGAASRTGGNTLKGRLSRRLLWGAANLLGQEKPDLRLSPRKARQAAILRNRFDTLAHRQVWLRALRRLMDGSFGDSPAWAVEALQEWRLP